MYTLSVAVSQFRVQLVIDNPDTKVYLTRTQGGCLTCPENQIGSPPVQV